MIRGGVGCGRVLKRAFTRARQKHTQDQKRDPPVPRFVGTPPALASYPGPGGEVIP